MADELVAELEWLALPGRGWVNLLSLVQGQVILIGGDAVGVYRSRAALADPLGNGAFGYELLPEDLRTAPGDAGYVKVQRSGYIGLHSGAALFIRPDGLALFANSQDALANRDMIWLIRMVPMAGQEA